MLSSEYKHIDADLCHDNTLTLHDCVAERIEYSEGILRFIFPDGFWIMPNHNDNNLGETVRTDSAVVDFRIKNIDDVTLDVFSRSIFNKTRADTWRINELIQYVNNGICKIEFIYQYRSSFEQMWKCAIHSNKKPYYRDCQLHIPSTEAVFYWNKLRPECEW